MAFFCLWSPGDDMVGPWIGIIVWAIPLGFIPTCTRAIIPRLVVEPKKLDFAMSTMGFSMALGKVLGGYFVSPSIVAFGYTGMARYTLAPMMVIGGYSHRRNCKGTSSLINCARKNVRLH